MASTAAYPTAVAQPPIAPPPATPASAPTAFAAGPYSKAPLGARLIAVLVDGIISTALLPAGVLLMVASLNKEGFPVLAAVLVALGGLWQIVYLLGRDVFAGAGWGKRLAGIVVVSQATDGPATGGSTIVRQLVLYGLGLIPVIGSLVEPVMVLVDKEGKRLGDKVAKTQVARASEVIARGFALKTGKGVAVGALIAAIVLSLIGGAAGGLLVAREVAGAVGPVEAPSPVETPGAQAPTETAPPAEEPAAQTEAPAGAVNKETAAEAVGNLLSSLKNSDVEAARPHATRRFQEDDAWFFQPAGGALIQFEVVDVYPDAATWVVEVVEQWNSGPQKSLYFVVEEDNTARVDGVDFKE